MSPWELPVSDRCAEIFSRRGAEMTLGGEPTFVPISPEGPEWSYSAVGPTKFSFARKMATVLLQKSLRGGVDFFTPGKSYPGEVNPRWAIRVLANRDGSPIFRPRSRRAATTASLAQFRKTLAAGLGVDPLWRPLTDPRDKSSRTWALVLDEAGGQWTSYAWPKEPLALTAAPGPAGLRLPLHLLAEGTPQRALTVQWQDGRLAIFLPPVLQGPFLQLLGVVENGLVQAGIGRVEMQGYVPADEARAWIHIGLTADPGVLEVNLPACADWREYNFWLHAVTDAAKTCGLRAWKHPRGGPPEGTGGGNHLLFGGPSVEENPFFTRPGWLASICRYWQRHPSLAYLFTGCYVGASSQAPRPDESARDLHDLEMALTFLESLPAGDHRFLIAETLRHLQTDVTGNAHRSEISLDKFWNPGWPSGTLGLIEFRAIESLPKAEWMSAVALLWTSLAAWLLERPVRGSLKRFSTTLHDRYFLPSILWQDFSEVLSDLHGSGFPVSSDVFRKIWEWKFPCILDFESGGVKIEIRRAHESWPLLCETPVDGGTTSRFVDTSMQRLEVAANVAPGSRFEMRFNDRPLPLHPIAGGLHIAGLRYRRTNLYPSLHPGLPPQLPLRLDIVLDGKAHRFTLGTKNPAFRRAGLGTPGDAAKPCKPGRRGELTCDLRIS